MDDNPHSCCTEFEPHADSTGRPAPGRHRAARYFRDLEQANRLILEAAGEGIYGVNAGGKTTFVNPAAARLLGWEASELVGRDMHSLVHHSHEDGSHYPDEACPIYAAFRDGAVHRVEDEVFWRKDGSKFHVEYTSTPIREDGEVVGAVIVFRDITQRREANEKLAAAHAEVERLRERLELDNAYLQEEIRGGTRHGILGGSAAIGAVLQQIALVAPTDASVLIAGESGTGKELIARAIHEASARKHRPMICVNCAALAPDSFESEFFGHVKGAFADAVKERAGRFEQADGATLFLDEVGGIPLALQGKLLRVLQQGQFERVGDTRTRKADVRVIAATNRDLKEDVRAGRFREDLYFRLNVVPIELRPLRERREDIPLLAAHFLSGMCRKLKIAPLRLTQGDARRLTYYDWPGNVRELENTIERGAILAQRGRVRLDLPDIRNAERARVSVPPARTGIVTENERRDRDRDNILAALDTCGGKVFGPAGAAELLNVRPTTLVSRMKTLGIAPARGRRGLTIGNNLIA